MFGRVLLLGILAILIFGLLAVAAQAGGWTIVDYNKAHDPDDTMDASGTLGADGEAVWNPLQAEDTSTVPYRGRSPHGGFSSTSNNCRVCHAVHGADPNSWRLLANGNTTEPRSSGELTTTLGGQEGMGTSRANECMYCHDATVGVTQKRPYGVLLTSTVRGEHTLGATWIPDSAINESSATSVSMDGRGSLGRKDAGGIGRLDCYQCHSVHGANILTGITAWGWGNASEAIDNYILRDDPGGNGNYKSNNINDTGMYAVQPPPNTDTPSGRAWRDANGNPTDTPKGDPTYPATETPYLVMSDWKFEIMMAWCGDCHNMNPNLTAPNDVRPNSYSHPLFGGRDASDTTITGGWMEVYATTTQVSGGAPKGCDGCHMSGQKIGGQEQMSWPHQSEGAKLLVTATTGSPMIFVPLEESAKSGPGDSFRVIANMDKACLWCHRFEGGTEGVGLTF